jgi:hypothetical protein
MRQTRSERWTEDVAVQASRLLVRKGVARRCRVEGHDAEVESKDGRCQSGPSSKVGSRDLWSGVGCLFLLKLAGGQRQSSTCVNT